MARIRTIKPEFWQDERVGCLSYEARLMFIACWNLADDEGLLKLNPAYLRAQIFPYDDFSLDDSKKVLGEIIEQELIFPYKDSKQQEYGWIVSFRKHQRIDKPQKAKCPLPSLQNPNVRIAYARRDDFVCHICGDPIDLSTDDKSLILSVDHLKPRAKGGSDAPSNVKPAHFGCNASKRDRRDDSETIPGIVVEGSTGEGKGKGKGKEQGTGKGTGNREGDEGSVALPTNLYEFSNEEYHPPDNLITEYGKAYPGIDVRAELRKMRVRLLGLDKTERRTSREMPRFISNWLQNAARDLANNPPKQSASFTELREAIDGL